MYNVNQILFIRVSDLVLNRLIECGWRDQVRLACRKILAENEGNNITIEDLVNKVTVKARSIVPDSVKRELLHELEVLNTITA